jgi:hypothetical protein
MKARTRIALVAGLLAATLPLTVCEAVDKYAGEFLKLGVGARALGMGGAFASVADDASAIYWNPAGLTFLRQGQAMGMHAEHFGGEIGHDFLTVAYPLRGAGRADEGIVAIGWDRVAVDDIEVTLDGLLDYGQDGVPGTGDLGENDGDYTLGETFDYSKFRMESNANQAFFFSYAQDLGDRFSIGGSVKLLRMDLVGTNATGVGADLGLLWRASHSLTLAAVAQDLTTTRISWDTGHRETMAPSFVIGSYYARPLGGYGVVSVAADLLFVNDGRDDASQLGGGADLHAGLEYWYNRQLALRVGTDAGHFTAGTGVRWRKFGVDYAFLSHDDLDNAHRVSGQVSF